MMIVRRKGLVIVRLRIALSRSGPTDASSIHSSAFRWSMADCSSGVGGATLAWA